MPTADIVGAVGKTNDDNSGSLLSPFDNMMATDGNGDCSCKYLTQKTNLAVPGGLAQISHLLFTESFPGWLVTISF